MKYSIDASSLIWFWESYPYDNMPKAWTTFEQMIAKGHVRACEEVESEITEKEDGLAIWAAEHEKLIAAIDTRQQKLMQEIMHDHPGLVDANRERSMGDPWVIALARSRDGCCVVTEEDPNKGKQNQVKIPHVCDAYGVDWMPFVEMIKRERWRI